MSCKISEAGAKLRNKVETAKFCTDEKGGTAENNAGRVKKALRL